MHVNRLPRSLKLPPARAARVADPTLPPDSGIITQHDRDNDAQAAVSKAHAPNFTVWSPYSNSSCSIYEKGSSRILSKPFNA